MVYKQAVIEMTLTEGLLIVIVIILTVLILSGKGMHRSAYSRTWDCIDRETGDMTSVKMRYKHSAKAGCKCPKCSNPEANEQGAQKEYFETCNNTDLEMQCDPNSNFEYAMNDFGGPGLDFKDWALGQAVDPAVLQNHAEFVADRLGTPQYWTGKTYTPETLQEFEGSDTVPWMGITSRPVRVQICSPTQITDGNENSFTDKRKLTWSST